MRTLAKIPLDVESMAREAKKSSRVLAMASTDVKNRALKTMAQALKHRSKNILEANAKEVAAAREAGRTSAFIDRLVLDPARLDAMAKTLLSIAAHNDPVGLITDCSVRPNGLRIRKMRVPLGVVMVIYESSPHVTADAAGLCLKSGNAAILWGGQECMETNDAIAHALQEGLRLNGLPLGSIGFVRSLDRTALKRLLALDALIDLIIPRGTRELTRMVRHQTAIPILGHDTGLCHIYVDESADLDMAEAICFNAKVEQPDVCNTMEILLVHEAVAPQLLPRLAKLLRRAGVELRADPNALKLLPGIKPATATDWETEYLDLRLSIKVVSSLQEAVQHIARHGSGLAEAIITNDPARAERFQREVDAGAVFANASTRFADAGEFGLGPEMGISTQKLHARGPLSLNELTCEKFVVTGTGQVRNSRRVIGV